MSHSHELGVDRGERIGAYAIAELTTGGAPFEIMDRAEIEAHRDRSSGWQAFAAGRMKSNPWGDELSSVWMWRKTPLRALCKVLPLSPTLQQVAVADELRDKGIEPAAPYTDRHDEIIDVSGDEPPQPAEQPEQPSAPEREPGQEG